MRPDSYRRRATAYLVVLGTTMLVTIIGLSALLAVRIQQRSAALEGDFSQARFLARSAIEWGQLMISDDEGWRQARGGGLWADHLALGDGKFSLEVTDPNDGDVGDSGSDSLLLTGTGYKDNSTYMLQVTLQPVAEPLEALNTCLHASGLIHVKGGKEITVSGAPLSTNDLLDNDEIIHGDADAASYSGGGAVTGTLTVPAPAKDLPEASVFDTYVALATEIPYTGNMEEFLLTPNFNPWGATNPDGVYYINTADHDMHIRGCRIHGTLVVDCDTKRLELKDELLLQPYRSDYPVLIVKGEFEPKAKSAEGYLLESDWGVNFNPPGSPYGGSEDYDADDQYPNEIHGLIHAIGFVKFGETQILRGLILCEGTVEMDGNWVEIIHDATLYTDPPMGYTTIEGMTPLSGSWKQTTN